MKCSVCEVDYEEKYFFMCSPACYKCVYARKIEDLNNKKKLAPLNKKCRICKTSLPRNKWVYCCYECAAIGKKKYQETFWQKTMKNLMPISNFRFGNHKTIELHKLKGNKSGSLIATNI